MHFGPILVHFPSPLASSFFYVLILRIYSFVAAQSSAREAPLTRIYGNQSIREILAMTSPCVRHLRPHPRYKPKWNMTVEMWAACVYQRENRITSSRQLIEKKAREETYDLLSVAVLFFKSLQIFYWRKKLDFEEAHQVHVHVSKSVRKLSQGFQENVTLHWKSDVRQRPRSRL